MGLLDKVLWLEGPGGISSWSLGFLLTLWTVSKNFHIAGSSSGSIKILIRSWEVKSGLLVCLETT